MEPTMSQSTVTTVASTVAPSEEVSKSDAYGKVKVFKESKLQQLMHIDEVLAGITLLLFHRPPPLKSKRYVREHFDMDAIDFVDNHLVANHVSTLLINILPGPVVVDAQVLSQVLRSVDCIEDEPTFYGDDVEKKIEAMLAFREQALVDPNWTLEGVGEGPTERRLLQNFPKIHRLYKSLRPESQQAIWDVTDLMARGMGDFLRKDLSQGTEDVAEYDRYLYIIAGSTGEALTKQFAASGLEDPNLAKEMFLSQQMGNFAMKAPMIYSFMEDYVDKRAKWPKTIWKQYSKTGTLEYFFDQEDPEVQIKSLQCLNAVCTDALEMLPDALKYASKIQCFEIFRWVAMMIVVATAQLDMCYANPKIFKGNIKIRKGLVCKLVLKTNNMEEVHDTLHSLTKSIIRKGEAMMAKNPKEHKADPGYEKTMKICQEILRITADGAAKQQRSRFIRTMITTTLMALGGTVVYLGGPAQALSLMGYDSVYLTNKLAEVLLLMGNDSSNVSSDADLTNKVATSLLVVFISMVYFFGRWVTTPTSNLKKCGR